VRSSASRGCGRAPQRGLLGGFEAVDTPGGITD
jgi:hypothetical protein